MDLSHILIFRGELEYEGQLEMSLWYTDGHPFAISCYLWCTEDGNLPSDSGGGDITGNDPSPLGVVSNILS